MEEKRTFRWVLGEFFGMGPMTQGSIDVFDAVARAVAPKIEAVSTGGFTKLYPVKAEGRKLVMEVTAQPSHMHEGFVEKLTALADDRVAECASWVKDFKRWDTFAKAMGLYELLHAYENALDLHGKAIAALESWQEDLATPATPEQMAEAEELVGSQPRTFIVWETCRYEVEAPNAATAENMVADALGPPSDARVRLDAVIERSGWPKKE